MAFGKRGLSAVLVAVGATAFCWVLLLAMSAEPGGAQTGGTTGTASANRSDEGCSDPRSITTFTGSEDQVTDEFRVTGDRFRIGFDTTAIDDGEPDETLDLTVRNANGEVEDTISVSEAGSGSEIISAGPGRFSLEIEAGDVEYDVTVEDCTGGGGDGGGNRIGGTTRARNDNANRRQYDDDNRQYDDNRRNRVTTVEEQTVIIRTIPAKPLPPTGGLPVYVMVGGSILAGAVLLVGRLAARRGRHG